jgi:hypothetical protein
LLCACHGSLCTARHQQQLETGCLQCSKHLRGGSSVPHAAACERTL